MKPALVISLLVLVGAGIASVSVLGDRADRRVQEAFDTPCRNPGDPFVALPAGFSYDKLPAGIASARGDGRSIQRGKTRVGAVFAFGSADAEVLPDAFAEGYAETGMERSERGDVIVLANGPERMLVGARGCHVLTVMTVPPYERQLEQAFFR